MTTPTAHASTRPWWTRPFAVLAYAILLLLTVALASWCMRPTSPKRGFVDMGAPFVPPVQAGGGGLTPRQVLNQRLRICEDFTADGIIFGPFTGAATSGNVTCTEGSATRPGVCTLTTLASATSNARISTGRAMVGLTSDVSCVEWIGVSVTALSDGTESFDVYAGIGDTINASAQTDGVGFIYNHNVSANWQIHVARGASVYTAELDGVNTDTVLRPVVVGDAAAGTGEVVNLRTCCSTTECNFDMDRRSGATVDGGYVHVGSAKASGGTVLNDRIPLGTGLLGAIINIIKSLGTTARTAKVDAVCIDVPLAGRID